MRPGEGRRKFERSARRTRCTEGGDRYCFTIRGGANGQLVAHSETVHAPDLDTSRAGARISRKVRADRRCADARYGHSLDPMADAVDVQPDLVTDRNVGDGRDLNVRRAGGRILS